MLRVARGILVLNHYHNYIYQRLVNQNIPFHKTFLVIHVAMTEVKSNVDFWLAEEISNSHWIYVNKDTIADVSLGLSNDK